MSHITNERMADFIGTICEQVREVLHERADDMLKAWEQNIEEAQEAENEKCPPLKISMSAAADIEAATISTTVAFTVKHQTKVSAPMRDPNQPELPIEEP